MTKSIRNVTKVSILALFLSLGLSYAYAWTAPTATPPSGNVSTPLNTSATEQTKTGGLTVDSATSTKDIVVNGVTVGQGSGSPSFSTAIGLRALKANLTGRYNNATGVSALAANTTGWYNTANGHYALSANNTGSNNTAVGTQALNTNVSGYSNTANGYQALYNIGGPQIAPNLVTGVTYTIYTTGSTDFLPLGATSNAPGTVFTKNTTIGTGTGIASPNANNNTALGNNSGLGIVSGSGNSIFGANVTALPANLTNNIILANGLGAIKAQHDGTNWTMQGSLTADSLIATGASPLKIGFGAAAGRVLTSDATGNASWVAPAAGGGGGTDTLDSVVLRGNTASKDIVVNGVTVGAGIGAPNSNVAIGKSPLFSNVNSASNVAIGVEPLYFSVSSASNVAIGVNALRSTTNSANNVAIGPNPLMSNTGGSNNVAIGLNPLISNTDGSNNVSIGINSLLTNTLGGTNVAVGYAALISNVAGSSNTGVGYAANVLTGALTNATAIGNGAVAPASNSVRIGNSAVTSIVGAVAWSPVSDRRLKKDIVDYTHGLDLITKLRPVEYKLKADTTNKQHSGFIAQEVEAIGIPFYGINKPASDSDYYSLAYSEFVVPLVNAVKELKAENDKLKADNDDLRLRIEKIEARMK